MAPNCIKLHQMMAKTIKTHQITANYTKLHQTASNDGKHHQKAPLLNTPIRKGGPGGPLLKGSIRKGGKIPLPQVAIPVIKEVPS